MSSPRRTQRRQSRRYSRKYSRRYSRRQAQPSMFWGRALLTVCVLLAIWAWSKGQG